MNVTGAVWIKAGRHPYWTVATFWLYSPVWYCVSQTHTHHQGSIFPRQPRLASFHLKLQVLQQSVVTRLPFGQRGVARPLNHTVLCCVGLSWGRCGSSSHCSLCGSRFIPRAEYITAFFRKPTVLPLALRSIILQDNSIMLFPPTFWIYLSKRAKKKHEQRSKHQNKPTQFISSSLLDDYKRKVHTFTAIDS
jgi:hypothetical protein